jgi:hypothetical protein
MKLLVVVVGLKLIRQGTTMTCSSAAVAPPLYSPFPPEAYSRSCGKTRAGVGFELRAIERRPLWNLYWLSEPKLDELAAGHPAKVDMELLRACGAALKQKLEDRLVSAWMQSEHPLMFAGALRASYRHLEPYKLRGRAWINTVLERAYGCRGVMAQDGPIVHVNFGGRTSDVTLAGNPAKIMPLAFKKN